MSGRRCKALRAAFKRIHGRAPRGATVSTLRRKVKGVRKLLFAFQDVVTVPSEWRRWKKDYRRSA